MLPSLSLGVEVVEDTKYESQKERKGGKGQAKGEKDLKVVMKGPKKELVEWAKALK